MLLCNQHADAVCCLWDKGRWAGPNKIDVNALSQGVIRIYVYVGAQYQYFPIFVFFGSQKWAQTEVFGKKSECKVVWENKIHEKTIRTEAVSI